MKSRTVATAIHRLPVAMAAMLVTGCGTLTERDSAPLATFLQIVVLEGKTCTLRCESGGRVGTLHLQGGQLVGASTAELQGDPAALEVLSWDEVGIEILPGSLPQGPTSGRPIEELVLYGLRWCDEAAREDG